MLVFSRKEGEQIAVRESRLTITVLKVRGKRILTWISAPSEVRVNWGSVLRVPIISPMIVKKPLRRPRRILPCAFAS